MNLFGFLFKKQAIVFLGRAGMHCYYGKRKYFIDSEILVGSIYDIVLYTDAIYLVKNGVKHTIDQATKELVLAFAKQELEKQGIKVEYS